MLPSLAEALGSSLRALERRIKRYDAATLSRLTGLSLCGPRLCEPLGGGDAMWPSLFSSYFRCPRRLWVERREGVRVYSVEEARRMLYGRVVHVLYAGAVGEMGVDAEAEKQVEGECCNATWRGRVDLLVGGVPVEVKATGRPSLGNRLQAMMYARLMGVDEALLVSIARVERVRVDEGLLESYTARLRLLLSSPHPPPRPTGYRGRCSRCPLAGTCRRYVSPFRTWDEFLNSSGIYPKGEECAWCPFRSFCRSFKAATGEYPCESRQAILVGGGGGGG